VFIGVFEAVAADRVDR